MSQNYSFGTVPIFQSRDVQFALMNTGTTSTPLTTLSVSAPIGPGQFSTTLAADGVSVTLTGTALTGVAISVISGGSAPAQLQAGAGIDFGSVAQGSTVTEQVVMSNPLQNAITIQNVAVMNLQGASFQLETVALPITLASGQSATLTVDSLPRAMGRNWRS